LDDFKSYDNMNKKKLDEEIGEEQMRKIR